jgi:hypothetical protein
MKATAEAPNFYYHLITMRRIYGGDPKGKISLLRSWAGKRE